MLEKFYGEITPDQFDTDYACDDIDAVNSDIDIAIFIYSGHPFEDIQNPNLPHTFIAFGAEDSYDGSIALFQQLRDKEDERFKEVNPELHIFSLEGDAPEEFVLQQQVTHNFNNQDVPVMVYTTADHGKYYFSYFMMGEPQTVYGKLIGEHPVEPDYDSSGGYVAIYGDHINIWNLVDPGAWEPRQNNE